MNWLFLRTEVVANDLCDPNAGKKCGERHDQGCDPLVKRLTHPETHQRMIPDTGGKLLTMSKSDSKQRFSNRVENYVKYRPDYPREILSLLRERISFANSWAIADI